MPTERTDWPAAPEKEPPAISAEDLALVNSDDVGDEPDDQLDIEVEINRKLLADGIFTVEELARHRGQSIEEVTPKPEPKAEPPSLSVEDELAEIADLRRTDKRAYFKDDALQARERELIEMRDKVKAKPAAAESETDEEGEAGKGLDPALVKEWDDAGGVAFHLKQLETTAQSVIEGVDEGARKAFVEKFDALPADVQTEVFRHIAVDGSSARPASAEDVEQFATTEEGGALVQEWGREAGRKLGIIRSRMGAMLKNMPADKREATQAWFDGLPSAEAKAVLKGLAGRS